jgi:hypothetical protein
MGLGYSIDLYFRIEDIEKALLATAEIASHGNEQIHVTLPDGKLIEVPFTSNFKSDPIQLTRQGKIDMDMVLLFPVEKAIYEYLGNWDGNSVSKDGIDYYRVGMIYLYIICGQKYAEFSYRAATSGMSRLFIDSPSVKQQFFKLLRRAGGLAGFIDIESYETPLIENSSVRITGYDVDFESISEDDPTDNSITRKLQAKSNLLTRWNTIDLAASFAEKWVIPFVTSLYPWRFLDKIPRDEVNPILDHFDARLEGVTDKVLETLFAEPNWRYWCVASCFIAFGRYDHFVNTLGSFLLRYPQDVKPFIFALARIGNSQAAQFLDSYLIKSLQPEQIDSNGWRHFEIDWALAALLHLDRANGTIVARKFIERNGLWSRYREQGLQALLNSETYRRILASHPDWLPETRKQWFEHMNFNRARRQLKSLLDITRQRFK